MANLLRILVVEDDPNLSAAMLYVIKSAYPNVVCDVAFTAREAFLYVDKHKTCVDLVMLDIGLPDRHGLELLEDIRKMSKDIKNVPVAVLSGSTSIDDMERAFSLDVFAYIVKPVSKLRIEEVVKTIGALKQWFVSGVCDQCNNCP